MEAEKTALQVFCHLKLYGIDISITSAVLVIWTAALIIFTVFFLATRKPQMVPGKMQSILEMIYEFFESQTQELLGHEKDHWLPFIVTIFCFILFCNLCALVPGVYPVTANINVTASLAILVFVMYNLAGIHEHGLKNYLKNLVPQGVPIYIVPLLYLIELLGHLARPFSLAIRLFANMTAGHLVAFTLISLIFIFKNIFVAPFPLLGKVAMSLFEIFIAFIQAYVFSYLAALYIGLAMQEE
jgi:F-type H+-transporting ATPase subunit a